MKVEFDQFNKIHTVSDGYATIFIVNGVAEIDVKDEDQVSLAEALGGKFVVEPHEKTEKPAEYLMAPEGAPRKKVKDVKKRGKK